MAEIKDYFKSLKDYRHWIMIVCIVSSLALIPFFFPYAHLRIGESCVALWNSLKFYVSELFGLDLHGNITVNDFTALPFELPLHLPRTWEEFAANLSGYWSTFFSMENFSAYMGKVADVLFYITKGLLIIMPLFLVFVIVGIFVKPKQNNDYGKESKALQRFKRFEKRVYIPVKNWVLGFVEFVRENFYYVTVLGWIWAYSFNIIAIVISFFAYFFYFICVVKMPTLYIQLLKLLMDLSVVPTFLWIIGGLVGSQLYARHLGYDRLDHNERRNRGFQNERGISNIVDGCMGAGKTQLITDMALSEEVHQRDMALEIIIESDFYFPNFPWVSLELFLKTMFKKHRIYDVDSCRRIISSKYHKWRKKPLRRNIWFYDFERYGVTYNDGLKDIDIWQAIEDYSCAYLIYTRQCSLLISNYSIRVDNLLSDLGNFPLWNTDFFRRDSRLIESFSRHSHIIDYDMLRLGDVMNKENPNRFAFGFGVYVISEIDKERLNAVKLRNKKNNKKDFENNDSETECNQSNDLFDLNIMMSRHAVTIANRCFLKILSDLQRFDELGISTRGLGENISIKNKTPMTPVLPFFSLYWLFDLVAGAIINRFDRKYLQYRYDRADYTLPMYLMKNFVALLRSHRLRVNNLFGCSVYSLTVEEGRDKSGEPIKAKYYLQSKKIWSNRYSTDCLSGIYKARAKFNNIGIDELLEYSGLLATDEELQKQNSHFQKQVHSVFIKND